MECLHEVVRRQFVEGVPKIMDWRLVVIRWTLDPVFALGFRPVWQHRFSLRRDAKGFHDQDTVLGGDRSSTLADQLGMGHLCLVTNALDVIRGRSVHPIYWNAIWKEVYDHLAETGALNPEPIDRARTKAYRALFPVALLLSGISKRPRKK